MSLIDMTTAQLADLSQLEAGQVFIHHDGDENRLALALKPEGEKLCWINLTGTQAFSFGSIRSGYRKHVLALGIPPERLRLRVDLTSTADIHGEHRPGQIVADNDEGVSIAGVWPELEEKKYRNVAVVRNWERSLVSHPNFLFDSWSLGYVGDDNQWIEVVSR